MDDAGTQNTRKDVAGTAPATETSSGRPASAPLLRSALQRSEALKALGALPALDAYRQSSEARKALGASPALDAYRTSSAARQAMLALGKSPAFEAARQSAAASDLLKALGTTPAPVRSTSLINELLGSPLAPAPLAPLPVPSFTPTPVHRLTPMRWRRWLLKRVEKLDEHLRRRHEGAWDAVGHGGPDAASQAAGSLVELIKGVLRESADREEVLRWLESSGRPDWGYNSNGHPTLRSRAEYFLIQQGVPKRSAKAYALALAETAKDLEAIKHGSSDGTMQFVVGSLLLFEALLVVSSSTEQSRG